MSGSKTRERLLLRDIALVWLQYCSPVFFKPQFLQGDVMRVKCCLPIALQERNTDIGNPWSYRKGSWNTQSYFPLNRYIILLNMEWKICSRKEDISIFTILECRIVPSKHSWKYSTNYLLRCSDLDDLQEMFETRKELSATKSIIRRRMWKRKKDSEENIIQTVKGTFVFWGEVLSSTKYTAFYFPGAWFKYSLYLNVRYGLNICIYNKIKGGGKVISGH